MINTQDFVDYPVFGENSSKTAPNSQKYPTGFIQADVLPAEWMNWAWYHNTKGITDLNTGLKITEQELNAILTAAGITPDEEMAGQIRDAIQALISAKTGTLSNLATTAKANLVAALNEVLSALNTGLATKQDALTFDSTPTSGSANPVTSNGIYTEFSNYGKLKTAANPSELNTNNFVDNGYYSIGSAAGRTNLPITSVGTLLVYNAGVYIIQEYITNDSSTLYYRHSLDNGETWNDWQQIATLSDLTSGLATKQNILAFDNTPTSGSANPVTSGGIYSALDKYNIDNSLFGTSTDLNTVLGVSDKVVTYALLGGSGDNYPTTQNGYLIVYNSSTRSRITQTYKSNETYYIYERITDNGGSTWSDWQKLATTSDLTTAVAALPRSESGTGDTFPISLGTAPTKSAIVTLQHTNSDSHCSYIFRVVDSVLVKHTIEESGTTITLGPSTSTEYPILVSSDTSLVNYWSVLYF